jgi:5-methylcytosine-specific restriction endonuclease McrA
MTRTGGRRWRRIRAAVLLAGARCAYCGAIATEVDHRQAIAEGGAELDPRNLVPSCRPCNDARGRATRRRVEGRQSVGSASRRW